VRTTPRAHYVRHNAVTRVPRAFVYLDTETYRRRHGTHEVQSWRLAVAAYDQKRHDGDGWKERDWHRSTDPHDLWTWITSKCRKKARTVLVAHNLAFDLRIADAFTILPSLGWRCVFVRLDGGQAMAIWRNESRTLSMVDSMSWVPSALEKLGALCGIPKPGLPNEDDSQEGWYRRCERDVEILAAVWLRLMHWIQDDDLGNWKPTGAGQSWSAFRHRFKTDQLLVHEDDDARAAERAASMTGRAEAWKVGKLSGGPFVEWDFTAAYCTIGAECDVPTQLCGEMRRPSLDKVLLAARDYAVLCEVEVTTDVPAVPFRDADGIRWPIGRFTTVLWNHELALVPGVDQGNRVVRAWVYRRAPALRDFCRWVLDGIADTSPGSDPIIKLALKHWSHTLIGRTAAQWPKWDLVGTSDRAGVSLGPLVDVGAGERWRLLQVGFDLYRQRDQLENPDAMVSIMSWIMAEARVRLWGAMESAGLDHVCYVDTDSVIVDQAGDERLREARIPGLRVKSVYESLEVMGPRQIVPGGVLRAAGVPRGARQVAGRVWEAEVWAGLGSSISEGEPELVRVALRRFRLNGTDRRRTHLADGSTRAVELGEPAVEHEIVA
jgi:hypothetical protein